MHGNFTIELEGLRFFAPHGLYAGEADTGNEFEVAVRLEYTAAEGATVIADTVDYTVVYETLRRHFQQRTELLETLCRTIADDLTGLHPAMRTVTVQIKKLTPAIAAFSGRVGVSYTKEIIRP